MVQCLGQLAVNAPEVLAALLQALHDDDERVRQAAARSLGQMRVTDDSLLCNVLVELNRLMYDDNVRIAATNSMLRVLDGRFPAVAGLHCRHAANALAGSRLSCTGRLSHFSLS
jgi:HEAT repeat protein